MSADSDLVLVKATSVRRHLNRVTGMRESFEFRVLG